MASTSSTATGMSVNESADVKEGGAAAAAASSSSSSPGATSTMPKKPIVLLFMGMAGSGKTTLVQRLNLYLNEKVSPALFPLSF